VAGQDDRASRADDSVGPAVQSCHLHGYPLSLAAYAGRSYHFQPAPPTETMVTTAPAAIVNRVSKLRTDKHPFRPINDVLSVPRNSESRLAHPEQFRYIGAGRP
jgi:hypothetical protein